MKEENSIRIQKWTLISCLTLGVISIVGIFFSLGNTNSVQFWSDVALKLTYLYVLGALALIIGFAAYQLYRNYRENKNFIFGLAGILALWGLGRMVANERIIATPKLIDDLDAKYGEAVDSMIKNVDAALYLTYFLLLVAIGAIVYNGIVGIFRK